ncbi:MAG: methylated-DNA--[protein]-cysteine S-methyltransferase [Gordonibacter sp.]|nr:methylated-DNA--[protein]-cysteine S-methyltransferase [Gordonibacter sp.]
MDYLDTFNSPVGPLTVASDGEALVGLWLDGQKYFEATLGETEQRPDLPILREARAWLDRYFAGEDPGALPAVRPRGTAFRQRVWGMLAQIPYGQLVTYGELARSIEKQTGARTSARAVGGAVGHNPISIILPCHRVVGSGGSLTGYAGGLQKKIALLELEGVDLSGLTIPARGTAL